MVSSVISIDSWKWLYDNKNNIKFSSNKIESKHLDVFVKSGLLVLQKGRYIMLPPLTQTLNKIRAEEKQLQKGVPLSCKNTIVNCKELQRFIWYRGQTKERKTFITNYEMIVFSPSFKGFTVIDSSDLLSIELLISQVGHAVFREDYLEIVPVSLRREGYFDVGIIGFLGEQGYSVSIDEGYYDLITSLWGDVKTPCKFVSIYAGKELVIIINPHIQTDLRYLEDIIAIVSPCEIEAA